MLNFYDAFGESEFDELYEKCERHILSQKKVNARTLPRTCLKENETGRIYIQNIDHSNSHSSFLDKVNMSNLCQEITSTTPIQHPDDEGEIALCILSAINVGSIKLEEILNLTELAVRGLDELIEQLYPVVLEISTNEEV